ncbi:MAG: YfhO family protein [Anaerolineales bacterium]|nr:YfhO family protein [Chloroflexota bacterium]MBL6982388.1 YfhO family protein [Anaerolineales bacterium]
MYKRIFRLPNFPIIIAPIILFSPHLFMGKALFWGTPALQFMPWWSWAWETILDGHLPLWNPLLGMGAPLIANYQSALFYPPNWLYFLTYSLGGVGLMAWMQSVVVVLHLVWAGLGMSALARRLGMNRLAQTVCGLAFCLSGYLVARAWFASINAAVAWLPWVMLFSYDVANERSRRSVLKLGLTVGMQLLAGHAQTAWYTLLLGGIWAAFWGWRTHMSLRTSKWVKQSAPKIGDRVVAESASRAGKYARSQVYRVVESEIRFGIAVLLGIGLAAVQLFPTAVYLMQSQRAGAVDMEFALNYSFWPWRFLGLLAPTFFGSPVTGDYWGYGNFWEDAVYVGLLPFAMAVSVLIRKFIQKRKSSSTSNAQRPALVLFLFSIISISVLLALGKNTPIYPWLYEHVPTFDMFQAPARISIWSVFGLALLAGIGTEEWRKPEGRGLYWTRLGTAGAFAISLGAGLTFFVMGEVSPTFIRATALAGILALGTGVFALTRSENPSIWWKWAVVAWVSIDLLIAGWGLNPGVDVSFYTQFQNEEIAEKIGDGRLFISADDEDALKYERFLQFDSFNLGEDWNYLRSVSLPNINMFDGIPSANNFDPFVPNRYARWMETLEDIDEFKRDQLLNLMGVSLIEELRGSEVYFEPRGNSTRLRWIPCAINAEDEEDARARVFFGEINFENTVVLEGTEPTQKPTCSSSQGQVYLKVESPNHLQINVKGDSFGWLIVSDVWYPGWQVSVDGIPAQLLRANYLFRAVQIPQGEHTVQFDYRPLEFYIGALLSFVILGAYLIAAQKIRIFRIFLR